jgi:ubiquinone/menaquinone biosynthesis C-methylase UbiE
MRDYLSYGVPTLRGLIKKQESELNQYENIILAYLQPEDFLMDAGCGSRTGVNVRGKCQCVIGIDVEQQGAVNKGIDQFVRADLRQLPLGQDTFNLVISWMVFEHLSQPAACVAEMSRVCRSGAVAVIGTPNLFHYGTLGTFLTPHWFQKWFARCFLGFKEIPFRTSFRANTERRLTAMMAAQGFQRLKVHYIDPGPVYLDWFTPLYILGILYHRLVTHFGALAPLRTTMVGVYRKTV